MKTLLLTLFLSFSQSITGKVIGVTDGDTITVLSDNQQHKIRLAEIDAPEKSQAFGSKSKAVLSEKIFGKIVTVDYKQKDRYNRIVGYVKLNNRNINLEMVQDGMAWQYTQYSKNPAYTKAQLQAQNNLEGLWVDPNPIAPWTFRQRPTTSKFPTQKSKSKSKRN